MTSAQRGIMGIVMAMIRFGMRVAEDRHQGQRQDDQREREEDVHEALQVEIDPPAEVGAAHAQDGPEGGAQHRGAEAHQERGARAVDEPREHVAAEGVGAEPVRRRGRGEHGPEVHRHRIVGREHGPRTPPPAIITTTTAAPTAPSGRRRAKSRTARRPSAARRPASSARSDARAVDRAGVDGHARAYRYRMRGSSQAYMTSMTKFTTMKKPGHQHHEGLDQRVVAVGHRLHEEQPEPVQVEHLLGDHEAADEEGELERDHRQHRQHRVLERVARQDERLRRAPWRARCGCSPRAAPRASPSGSCGWPPPSSGSRRRAPAR